VVLLSFDDNLRGDFIYAKPILDKYGFKATFFIICNKTGISGTTRFLNRTNWQDIAAMQKDGMDIQSHTMNHRPSKSFICKCIKFRDRWIETMSCKSWISCHNLCLSI